MAKTKKRTRASNGMGSVRQRTDGRWEARYTAPDGRQKSVYGKTEKDVTAKLRGVLHDIDTGSWMEPSKMTVGEWLAVWMRDYQAHASANTRETYRSVIRSTIAPVVGNVKLSALSKMHVRRMVTSMQARNLSPATIRHACAILSGSMRSAIEAGLINSNPAENIKLPRIVRKPFHVVDREKIPEFIRAAEQTQYANELAFMLYTGVRVGEMCGLLWDDIDFDAATIHVQRQYNSGRYSQPKNGETRLIHVAEETVNILKRQRVSQLKQRIASEHWTESDVVFGRNGEPHGATTIYKAVKRVGEMIGIPELHPHDLRHSYAIAALRSGADAKTVQHNLGHKSAAMTLDVYAAYTSDAGKDSARKLSEYLKNAGK